MFNSEYRSRLSRAVSISPDWQKEIAEIESKCKIQQITRFKETVIGDSNRHKFQEVDRPTRNFVTGSSYTGTWNALGLNGFGLYAFTHGNITKLSITNLIFIIVQTKKNMTTDVQLFIDSFTFRI